MFVKTMEELEWNQAHVPFPTGFSALPAAMAAAWGDSTAGRINIKENITLGTAKPINKME